MIGDEECALWRLAVATPPVPGAIDVYLDWLLEHDPPRGEVLGRHVRREAADSDRAGKSIWRAALGLSEGVCTDMHLNPLPYFLYVDPYELASLEPVLDRLPFLDIYLECGCPSEERAAQMAAQPVFAKIRRLHFSAFADYPSNENYQSMDREYHGNQVLAALCASPNLVDLEALRVSEDWMDPSYGAVLAAAQFRNLRRLEITSFPMGDRGVATLAASPVAAKLRQLHLRNHQIEDAGAIAIATHLRSLEVLDVRHNKIGEAGIAALRSLPAMQTLLIE